MFDLPAVSRLSGKTACISLLKGPAGAADAHVPKQILLAPLRVQKVDSTFSDHIRIAGHHGVGGVHGHAERAS